MCLHNTVFHYLDGSHKDRLFNNWKDSHILNEEEVFLGWTVHTSSYFIRKEYAKAPDFGRKCIAGDMVRRTWLYTIGKLVSLPQIMSVYNAGVENGAMDRVNKAVKGNEKFSLEAINYYKELNIATEYKFSDIIEKTINYWSFNILCHEKSDIIKNSNDKKEIISAAKAITSHEYYRDFIKGKPGLNRICTHFKYEGYIIYPLWRFAYLLYYGRKQNKRKSQ